MAIVTQGYGFSWPECSVQIGSTPITVSMDRFGRCLLGPDVVASKLQGEHAVQLSWKLLPPGTLPEEFTFDIQRSQASYSFRETSDFETIARNRAGISSYTDRDVNLQDWYRQYYYRVVATSINHPGTQFFSRVIALGGAERYEDLIIREIRYRNDLLLRQFTGMPCALFLKKSYGQRCHVCWDGIMDRCSDGKCESCYRTTYLGGYYLPVFRYVNFQPAATPVAIDVHGKEQRVYTRAIFTHDPILMPGDIVKNLTSGEVWDIAQTDPPTSKLGNVGHQNLVLYRLDHDDIECSVPGSVDTSELCKIEFGAVLGR